MADSLAAERLIVARKSDSRLEYAASNSSRRGIDHDVQALAGRHSSDRLKISRINLLARFLSHRVRPVSGRRRFQAATPGIVGRHQHREYRPFARVRQFEHSLKLVAAPAPAGPWRSARMTAAWVSRIGELATAPLRGGNRQALTSLGAAPLQHLPAVFRGHAHEETVRALAAPAVWLERRTLMMSRTPARNRNVRRNLNSNQTVAQRVSIAKDRQSAVCQRVRPLCYSRVPLRPAVGSPPEVFHNCGKKCGKAPIFPL